MVCNKFILLNKRHFVEDNLVVICLIDETVGLSNYVIRLKKNLQVFLNWLRHFFEAMKTHCYCLII